MLCPDCGAVNQPDARFCANCGTKLEEDTGLLQPGQTLDEGTYRILNLLGKGGMGAVYLAANTKAFDRPCVVKEVIEYYDPTDPEERRKALQRFEDEARTLAALKHTNIPDIYAYFTRDGHNYLVMEYIEGTDLSEGLSSGKSGRVSKGGPQPVDDVVQYAIEICGVLAYLEGQQPPVIHNDIKPANIILDKNTGRAVLVDFGTAKTRYLPSPVGRRPASLARSAMPPPSSMRAKPSPARTSMPWLRPPITCLPTTIRARIPLNSRKWSPSPNHCGRPYPTRWPWTCRTASRQTNCGRGCKTSLQAARFSPGTWSMTRKKKTRARSSSPTRAAASWQAPRPARSPGSR
jgi:serine/threonine protein kinase